MGVHSVPDFRPGAQPVAAAELDLHISQSSTETKVKIKADDIDATNPAVSVEMLDEAITSVKVIIGSIYPTCTLHNAEFQGLKELHLLKGRGSIREAKHLFWQILRTTSDEVVKTKAWSTVTILQPR